MIDNSFNLLAQIQLYLISNHIWVRNKDIVNQMKQLRWISFTLLTGGFMFGVADRYLASDYTSVEIALPFFLLTCIIFDYEH
jgi:hypothetical protein